MNNPSWTSNHSLLCIFASIEIGALQLREFWVYCNSFSELTKRDEVDTALNSSLRIKEVFLGVRLPALPFIGWVLFRQNCPTSFSRFKWECAYHKIKVNQKRQIYFFLSYYFVLGTLIWWISGSKNESKTYTLTRCCYSYCSQSIVGSLIPLSLEISLWAMSQYTLEDWVRLRPPSCVWPIIKKLLLTETKSFCCCEAAKHDRD